MHARVSIRKTRPQGPPPSPDEIDAWLGTYPGARGGITEETLFDAFNTGSEVGPICALSCHQNNPRAITRSSTLR